MGKCGIGIPNNRTYVKGRWKDDATNTINDEWGSHRLKVTPEVVDWPRLASLPQVRKVIKAKMLMVMR